MNIKVNYKNQILNITASKGERLLDVLLKNNINIKTDCGGKGRCNKCKVFLNHGSFSNCNIDKNGYVLSCLAYVKEDCEITVCDYLDFDDDTKTIINSNINKGEYSIAFDLGTTTLAFSLVEKSGQVIERYSVLNKESIFGADVISRISASNEGNLENMFKIITGQLNDAINYFLTKYNIQEIESVVVSGNTTMLHIFLNVSPETIGVYPFTPVFLDSKILDGSSIGVNANKIKVLPSFSAYVGADIVSGVYSQSLEDNCLLIDLGTNGEVVYKKNGKYFCTSTAAGPCLEGASIDCGLGGVKGAIKKVTKVNNELCIETIQNEEPTGICGAGLIDIIACLVKDNIIDYSGALNAENDKFMLSNDIFLSSSDVRKFQLAKSAIYSGIVSLLEATNSKIEDIDKIYLAGGIGYHIDIKNAMYVGLLPSFDENKVKVSGNSSLLGAEMCIIDNDALEKMEEITHNCSIIDLNTSATFSSNYVTNMFFLN